MSQLIMCVTGSDCLSKSNDEGVGISHHYQVRAGLFFLKHERICETWPRLRNTENAGARKTTNTKQNILLFFLPVVTIWTERRPPSGQKRNLLWQKMLKDFVSCSCTADFMLMNLRCRLLCKHELAVFWERRGFDI